MKDRLTLVFRKPAARFNSIETVFNAMIPYFQDSFDVNRVCLPCRTDGLSAMRKNRRYIDKIADKGLVHITGHDNYAVSGIRGNSVLTIHDMNSAFTGNRVRDIFITYNWFKTPIRRATALTTISRYSASEMAQFFPGMNKKLSIIPNPVDDRFSFREYVFNSNKPRILHIGTKVNKNLERVISALAGMNVVLLILGLLSKEQQAMLLENKIDFHQYIGLDFNNVIKLYESADIVLFPSLYEGFGMPILEAQATGRPVITSNTTAMPETAGDGAYLVNPQEVHEIRDAVLQLIENSSLRLRLIEAGRRNVANYSASAIAEHYITLYKSLL